MKEERGLANGVLIFFAVILVASIMVIVLDPVMAKIPIADHCTVDACDTGEGWVQDAWTYFPLFAAFIAFVGIVRQASLESRRQP